MINFYRYYNKTGLDKEEYRPLIGKLTAHFGIFSESAYTTELKPIESIIKKSPRCAFHYALFVIKGRWPEAEPYIMKNRWAATYYAADVIKDRWLEVEPYIMEDRYYWNCYCVVFRIC
jgi:hypothetical protein